MEQPEINWHLNNEQPEPGRGKRRRTAADVAGTVIAWILIIAVTVVVLLLVYKLARWAVL